MFCSNCGFQLPANVIHCPRCGAPVQGQQWTPTAPSPSPSRDRHGVWSSFGFVCVVFATAIYAVSSMKAPVPEAPAQHEGSISASRLVKEFRANEATAERAWQGRIVAVDGTIDRIGVSWGKPYVVLSGGGVLDGVRCGMDKTKMNEAAQLKQGQPVTVQGMVDSFILGNIMLKDCQLLQAQAFPQPAVAEAPRDPCARISGMDVWLEAGADFRGIHPECRPAPRADLQTADATDIIAEYQTNEVAADQKWRGKAVAVNGTVESIETDLSGAPRLVLKGAGRWDSMTCSLDTAERNSAATLRPGQSVTVVGRMGDSILKQPRLEAGFIPDRDWSLKHRMLQFLLRNGAPCGEVMSISGLEDGDVAVRCRKREGTAFYIVDVTARKVKLQK